MLYIALHLLCDDFAAAGQLHYEYCPICRFVPISGSMCQVNGKVKGHTQGCGFGFGLLGLAMQTEFVCSQRKFFMGGLTQG